ncbi:MAG: hypothetical protein GOMPHAMPRED_003216 [Gomphillus americanus]|uniref:Uncharacterized protein n=1 Tax=Gomphillus americanus TaxID=1940652 RepID=A0A8H3EH25_9LECA|nr:MAG: hypothetical protein GOMPHAMPRED_003216 [Gomphillus americanus]
MASMVVGGTEWVGIYGESLETREFDDLKVREYGNQFDVRDVNGEAAPMAARDAVWVDMYNILLEV